MAAQEQALRTIWARAKIDGEDVDSKCRLCIEKFETFMHVARGCGELATKQYNIRHDMSGAKIHLEMCNWYGFECVRRWFEHVSSSMCRTKDDDVVIYWDMRVETARAREHTRPDIVVIEKSKWTIVDFSMPTDQNAEKKVNEKCEILSVVIGAFETVPKTLAGKLKKLRIPDAVGCLQTSAPLTTIAFSRTYPGPGPGTLLSILIPF